MQLTVIPGYFTSPLEPLDTSLYRLWNINAWGV